MSTLDIAISMKLIAICMQMFNKLRKHFNRFALDLPCDRGTHEINGDCNYERIG